MAVTEHIKCNKEGKIDSMDKTLRKIHGVVFERTNGDSLVSMAQHTKEAIEDIGSDVRQLLIFRTVLETEREMKQEAQEKKAQRLQWVLGLLIGTALSLLAIIVTLIHNANS